MVYLIILTAAFWFLTIYSTYILFKRRDEYINIHNTSPQLARKKLANLLFACVAAGVSLCCNIVCTVAVVILLS